jgi:hypothetical protein
MGVRVFIGVILLSACLANLAREMYQQNEKPDLLSGRVNFGFNAPLGAQRAFQAKLFTNYGIIDDCLAETR